VEKWVSVNTPAAPLNTHASMTPTKRQVSSALNINFLEWLMFGILNVLNQDARNDQITMILIK
jgi:hypothetical protein